MAASLASLEVFLRLAPFACLALLAVRFCAQVREGSSSLFSCAQAALLTTVTPLAVGAALLADPDGGSL